MIPPTALIQSIRALVESIICADEMKIDPLLALQLSNQILDSVTGAYEKGFMQGLSDPKFCQVCPHKSNKEDHK